MSFRKFASFDVCDLPVNLSSFKSNRMGIDVKRNYGMYSYDVYRNEILKHFYSKKKRE